MERSLDLKSRVAAHAALGDEHRLRIVDLLASGDLSVRELAIGLSIEGNLLAHHLGVLQDAGVISRRQSEGDQRRRYVTLNRDSLEGLLPPPRTLPVRLVFVCSRNSARSQYAAARWNQLTGGTATSAGSDPASEVHPAAVKAAAERGVDISGAVPQGFESLKARPDLVISVCDRAREDHLPDAESHLHWSIPDPVSSGTATAFQTSFAEIDRRIEGLRATR